MIPRVRIYRIPRPERAFWIVKDIDTGKVYFQRSKMSEAIHDVEEEGFILEPEHEYQISGW